MTVRYIAPLATNSSWGCFSSLLFKWRGSVYKLVWAEYLVFIMLYYVVFFIYRCCLNEEEQKIFETIAEYCEAPRRPVEMSFVLGFFVTTIVRHWWQLYQLIPWPDGIAHYINASIRGNDAPTKLLRRNILRYCNLSIALTFHSISPAFRKRYPNFHSFVKMGILLEKERPILEKLKSTTTYGIEWLPISWATDLMSENNKRNESKILEELDKFRKGCALLQDYESVSVPLVYVQVVTISVYTYFLLCLVSRQWLIRDEDVDHINLYFPFFTTLQFIFHMGWFKVAESLINPFGSDDDDFELDQVLKRHWEVTQLMMDMDDEFSLRNVCCQEDKTPILSKRNGLHVIECDGLYSSNLCQETTELLPPPTPNLVDLVTTVEVNQQYENMLAPFSKENHNAHQRPASPMTNFVQNCFENAGDDGGSVD